MKRSVLIAFLLLLTARIFSQDLMPPEKFFGFVPGTDRMVFTYEKLTEYLQSLDGQSDS
jgi:hypothetical protein